MEINYILRPCGLVKGVNILRDDVVQLTQAFGRGERKTAPPRHGLERLQIGNGGQCGHGVNPAVR